jgi:hypothetical protein
MTIVTSNKLSELVEEFRTVVVGRSNLLDTVLPPLAFALLNARLGFRAAIGGALGVALIIAALRWRRGQSLTFALGGVGGVGVALLLARWLDRAEGFFLPGIVTGGLVAAACLISIVLKRPLVAWTSHFARRWPQGWYWHPKVRPAYSEVTGAWALFFAARLLLQLRFFQQQAAGRLAIANALTGWPATIVLLAASYLYGTWRLRNLNGPSVQEFRRGAEPPWQGQRRGF